MDNDTIPFPSNARYNPHSNRGRKKQSIESENKRTQQMREAQRALRARKQDYLRDLESRVKELVEENSLLKLQMTKLQETIRNSPTDSVPCFNANCVAQIQALQMQILELQAALAAGVNTPTSIPISGDSEWIGSFAGSSLNNLDEQNHASSDWIWDTGDEMAFTDQSSGKLLSHPCAEELYGPMQFEPYKTQTKSLSSLNSSKIVDRIFDLFIKSPYLPSRNKRQSRATDTRIARVILLKTIREHMRLTDRCSVLDRVNFLEITANFQVKNSQHLMHFRNLCAPPDIPKSKIDIDTFQSMPRVGLFREALRSIPSLADSFDIIDHLSEFWIKDNEEYDAERFFQLNQILHSLSVLCVTVEDKKKFWMAFELVRTNKRKEVDELLAGVEAVII
ncbi:hypothetical protein HK100_003685 [Physocladia obscura]|uniref:BZIP domain-containing protein n=1 Tax=Physocladia obscura TaxID=109957 RepID=A0AAD5XEF2_9FUNG|nr:hypothetical protein HK100_003685 [Physocladia obscura]